MLLKADIFSFMVCPLIAKIAKTFSVKELLMYPVCSRLPRINNSNLVRGLLLNIEASLSL